MFAFGAFRPGLGESGGVLGYDHHLLVLGPLGHDLGAGLGFAFTRIAAFLAGKFPVYGKHH